MKQQEIINSLRQLGIKPNKLKGQNFLFDDDAIFNIINFASVSSNDEVLEIGPGLGAISSELHSQSKNYSFIELESNFAKRLKSKLSLSDSQVIVQDIRDYSLTSTKVVVGNIPYSISTDIILWCIKNRKFIKRATFLMQKEFARRIAANPGERKCSSISVLRSIYGNARLSDFDISGDSFYPVAKVESSLLELVFFDEPKIVSVDELNLVNKVIRTSFQQRRKTILNSLQSLNSEEFSLVDNKNLLKEALIKAEIDPKLRAENLLLKDWISIAGFLKNCLKN